MEKAIAVRGDRLPDVGQDVLEAFGAFLRLRVADGDASPLTVRVYYSHLRSFVEWCKQVGVDPARATEGDIEAYRRHLIEAGLSRSTVGGRLQAIRRFYHALQWRGYRLDNPAVGIRPPKDRTDRSERVRFLPLAGFRQVLSAPAPDTPVGKRDRLALVLMGVHGLRVSEVVGLRLQDVDGDTLRVKGKGGKVRTVYLTPTTEGLLHEWLAVRPDTDSPYLLVSLDRACFGKPLSTTGLRKRVDAYLHKAGLKGRGVSCHSLRHSCATWARFAGADLQAIGDTLGHSSIDTTRIYSRIVDRLKANPAGYLESLLEGGEVAKSGINTTFTQGGMTMEATQVYRKIPTRIRLQCPLTGKVFEAYPSKTHPACQGFGGLALWVREDTGEPIGIAGHGFWRAYQILEVIPNTSR